MLDRPTISRPDNDTSTKCASGTASLAVSVPVPGADSAGVARRKKKPRIYRVMLHNDSFNKREYVVAVIMRVIKSLSVDDAVNVMNVSPLLPTASTTFVRQALCCHCWQEAHKNGIACVIACAQEEAEGYCEGLRGNGLISSIEPDGSGSGGPSD